MRPTTVRMVVRLAPSTRAFLSSGSMSGSGHVAPHLSKNFAGSYLSGMSAPWLGGALHSSTKALYGFLHALENEYWRNCSIGCFIIRALPDDSNSPFGNLSRIIA